MKGLERQAIQAARELERRFYLSNLYELNNEVLGYSDMAEAPHRLMCSTASDRKIRLKMHKWPRGHFKSSMITVGYVVQRICENPNIRILITNVSLGNAQSFLREIKGHFERNERLIGLYGNHVGGRWNDDQIISAQRTRNLKEPTVQVAGVGQGLASQHYDLILGDDLVNEMTVTTPAQIQKTIDWFRMAYSLLEPGGEVIVIGTRYHQADLYGFIEKNYPDFDNQSHSVYVDDDPDRGFIFPSRFTAEVVSDIRKKQGSYIFSCQYRNRPVSSENAKFHEEDFRYYLPDDLDQMTLYTTMTVDRAYSLANTADSTGITVRSVNTEGKWYVRYAKRHKQSEGEIIEAIFNLKNYFKCHRVGVEQKAFKYTLQPTLEREMRVRQDFFTVVELKDGGTAKFRRIEGLVPVIESHSMYFLRGEMADLEDELTAFPMAAHDDLADSLAYHDDAGMRGSPVSQANRERMRGAQRRALAGEA